MCNAITCIAALYDSPTIVSYMIPVSTFGQKAFRNNLLDDFGDDRVTIRNDRGWSILATTSNPMFDFKVFSSQSIDEEGKYMAQNLGHFNSQDPIDSSG